MDEAIKRMTQEIREILGPHLLGVWLYGSTVLNDFRPGWSDIDFIALTDGPLTEEQAGRLLPLRQQLSALCPDNPYYRCFEGIIAGRDEFSSGRYTRLVYWGTTGQRVTDRFRMDVFSRYELAKYGRQVLGNDEAGLFILPGREELADGVREHYETIRMHAVRTDEKLYSCGWLLDIARCIYTLRHHDVIAKMEAGLWALDEHLFDDEMPLRKAVMIRRNPLEYKNRPEIREWLCSLGPTVQKYADVLENELLK